MPIRIFYKESLCSPIIGFRRRMQMRVCTLAKNSISPRFFFFFFFALRPVHNEKNVVRTMN